MSPFGRALEIVKHDKTVVEYMKACYWSRASRKQHQRLNFEEKATALREQLTPEQTKLVSSVHHIWNRYQRQTR